MTRSLSKWFVAIHWQMPSSFMLNPLSQCLTSGDQWSMSGGNGPSPVDLRKPDYQKTEAIVATAGLGLQPRMTELR